MRNVVEFKLKVGDRVVTAKAMDSVGVEDCYENAIRSVAHRYVTSEDLTMPVVREVKDFIIRTNLTI
jgi:3-deoxy-D-manno-octulosonate 8-phosphate phosphatase KdsC-like HAD superfamily phosphatase